MEKVWKDINMKRKTNAVFVEKARKLLPKINEKLVKAVQVMQLTDEGSLHPCMDYDELQNHTWKKDDTLILDFKHHQVGYLTLKMESVGSPQDAPTLLKLKFCEIEKELLDQSEDYNGWISKGWFQEEYIHIDELPAIIVIPRRYAFRFLQVEVIDTSPKYQIRFSDIICKAVSSVDMQSVVAISSNNDRLLAIDQAAVRTLQNCMQEVFEDGPKRDRRLWLGDLRLQALVNYETFKEYCLVKRCLYLFAGLTREDGAIGACVFAEPRMLVDDTFFLDYSLFFVLSLKEYLEESRDKKTALELLPSALRQIEIAQTYFDKSHIIAEEGVYNCFVDWKDGLDKRASMQGIYIYAVKAAIELCYDLEIAEFAMKLQKELELCKQAAMDYFWCAKKGLFTSGETKQLSCASQVWMILAEVVTGEEAKRVLDKIPLCPIGMVTPYMNHYYVEALLMCGEEEKAFTFIEYYWGGMVEMGADTFWELHNPDDLKESPYGSNMVNSYCHAWSCTPSYFLRKKLKRSKRIKNY